MYKTQLILGFYEFVLFEHWQPPLISIDFYYLEKKVNFQLNQVT